MELKFIFAEQKSNRLKKRNEDTSKFQLTSAFAAEEVKSEQEQ